MSTDLYEPPKSNLQGDGLSEDLPPLFGVVGWLVLASIVLGGVLYLVEMVLDAKVPNALSTILPAMIVGLYYGNKRGVALPAKFKLAVLFSWLLVNVLIGVVYVATFGQSLLDELDMTGVSVTLLLVVMIALLIGFAISYFVFGMGEKIGIKQKQKALK